VESSRVSASTRAHGSGLLWRRGTETWSVRGPTVDGARQAAAGAPGWEQGNGPAVGLAAGRTLEKRSAGAGCAGGEKGREGNGGPTGPIRGEKEIWPKAIKETFPFLNPL
jgi:hypothetical protein